MGLEDKIKNLRRSRLFYKISKIQELKALEMLQYFSRIEYTNKVAEKLYLHKWR